MPDDPGVVRGYLPHGRRVWLIGLMGAGKSTIGRELARRRGWPYLDNDSTIADLAGRSTVDLASGGDGLLHQWESRYVRHLTGLPAPVVAGVPASAADRPDDLSSLRASGLLVYLWCDVDTLVARVAADGPRPFMGADVAAVLGPMYDRRDAALKAAAHAVLDATQRPAAVVDALDRVLLTRT